MIGERLGKLQFLTAGKTAEDRVQASLLAGEMDRLYIEWGLLSIEGLTIDNESCDPARLLEYGPETVCSEIASAIKRECTLSADELKN
ncbi:MAG: hypothetical protein NTY38_13320 [Acidobacteria bacterium]|nr:hypothetical protein [Acidobacteriota bacterium]